MKTKKVFKSLLLTLCIATLANSLPFITAAANNMQGTTFIIDTNEEVTLYDKNSDGFYELSNANEVYAFASAVNNGYSDIKVELTTDIVVNENVLKEDGTLNGDGSSFRKWEPAGYDSFTSFTGQIKGNGYSISGLYYSGDLENIGFIGLTGDSITITGLGIEDSYFHSNLEGTEDMGLGGIVGVTGLNNDIEHCHFQGTLNTPNYFDVGGICGKTNENTTVTACYTMGHINGKKNVGGIVGFALNSSIEKCYLVGRVDGETMVAGMIGRLYTGYIKHCYAIGETKKSNKIVGSSFYGTFSNYYYQAEEETDTSIKTTSKTAVQVANGEICKGVGFHSYHTRSTACGTLCALCSEIIGEGAHVWDEGKITTPPTCKTAGVKTYTCTTDSAHTKTEEIPIDTNAHVWDEGVVTKQPTTTEKGIKTYTCTQDRTHTKTEEIPMLEGGGCAGSVTGISLFTVVGVVAFVFIKKNKEE